MALPRRAPLPRLAPLSGISVEGAGGRDERAACSRKVARPAPLLEMFGAPGANDREPHSSQSPVSPGQRLFDESLSPSSDRGSPIAPPFVSRGGRSPLATRKKSLAGAPSRPRAPDEPTGAAAPRRPKSIAPLNMDLVMGKRRARIARARALAAVAQQRPPQGPVVAAVPMDSESDTGDGSPGSMSYRFSESGTFETRSSASSVRASANAGVVMVVRENGIVPLAVGRPFGNTPSWSRAGPRARSRTAKPSSRVSGRSGGGRHPVTAAEAAAASSSHWSARVVTGPEGRKRGDSLDALDTSTRLEPAARGGGSSSAARSRRAAPDAPEDAAALARNLGNLDIRAGGAARPQPQPLSLPLAPVRGVTPEKAAVSLSPLGCGELASSSAASASVGANASNTPASSNVHRRHFLALDRLGRGASAVVSKALHVPSLTIVAVKVVRIFQDAKRRQFERELHALRSSAMIAPMGLVRPWSESERVAAVTAAAARGSASWSGSGASDSIDDMETTPRAARRKRPRAALSDGSSRGDDAIAVAIEGDDDGLATTHSPWRLPVPCPHIVACHGAFTDAKRATLSIVLEYMDAGSLQDLIDAGLRVPESSLANIARRLCLALLWIHRRRQLHRDIKPSNLLIDARGAVKLSDFGISRDLDGDDGHTMQVRARAIAAASCGNAQYSPEAHPPPPSPGQDVCRHTALHVSGALNDGPGVRSSRRHLGSRHVAPHPRHGLAPLRGA